MAVEQKDFSKTGTFLGIPNLLSLQLDSFADFVQVGVEPAKRKPNGLEAILQETFPVEDVHKNFRLEYLYYSFGDPKYQPEEAIAKGVNYSMPLKVTFRLVKKEFGAESEEVRDMVEQEVFFCELPWMTRNGTFIINGVERVVVNQLHRSPGVYYSETDVEYSALLVPLRGAWFEVLVDKHRALVVLLDRKRRISAATFLRAIGFDHSALVERLYTVEEKKLAHGQMIAAPVVDPGGDRLASPGEYVTEGLLEFLEAKGIKTAKVVDGNPPGLDILSNTLLSDKSDSKEDAIKRIYYRLRSIAPHSIEVAENVILGMLFDKRRFDLSPVGRHKLNRRLMLNVPLSETGLRQDDVMEIILHLLRFAGDARFFRVSCQVQDRAERARAIKELKGAGLEPGDEFYSERLGQFEVTYSTEDAGKAAEELLRKIGLKPRSEAVRIQADDVDHLANRRVKQVGELLENQFRVALMQLAQNIRERAAFIDESQLNPQELVNTRVVANAILKFFTQSQLCQFMEQTNPLAELTHKRRVSTLGPGGLTKETAGFEVRDVHYSHYGRICPIETPEGPNIGLISTVSTYAKVDQFGFLVTPYWPVRDGVVQVGRNREQFLTPEEEEHYTIAQANTVLTEDNRFAREEVICRRQGDVVIVPPDQVDFMDVSPRQLFSASTVMIPFLEHDDADRALMGSNMQRQGVPLLLPQKPLVATGVEGKFAAESGAVVLAEEAGIVTKVDARTVVVRSENGLTEHRLRKFKKSNQYTCLTQRPTVRVGDKVKKGDLLADGPGTEDGQLALGRNVLVAFVPWRGYNYEDAIIVSENLIKDDAFTSIQILEFEIQARETKLGAEEITRDIPGATEEELGNLDEFGVIRVGAEVGPGDILVGRITPKGETEFTPEERLLRAIFGEKAANVKDSSLRVDAGVFGVVVTRRILSRKLTDAMSRRLERERQAEAGRRYELKKQFLLSRRDEKLRDALRDQKAAAPAKDNKGRVLHKAGQPLTDEFLESEAFGKVRNYEQLVSNSQRQVQIQAALREFDEALAEADHEKRAEIERVSRGDELPHGVLKWITIFIAQKRRLAVGDKMAGRHGNKGVVSKVLPIEDMPYVGIAAEEESATETVRGMRGMAVDMILNPLGVPSRMNLGQVFETHLGWAAKVLGYQAVCPVFQSATPEEIRTELVKAGLPADGKLVLTDGRTGETFDGKVMSGMVYMMKLIHMVDDKIHARSTGRYSLITQQPLGGKAQFGGQRFGEMEVWALEAYGASHALQEMLTIKSDDVEGRSALYEALIRGKNPPRPKPPASFAVLVKELQGLGLELNPQRGEEGE
ncbi:DNA-directed RNA polymerase subunit beta [candidate division WOR-3 bacterium]|nr:DNA-directed RNA polymerase subunit beta [candidate division WOR-3 bacterium]